MRRASSSGPPCSGPQSTTRPATSQNASKRGLGGVAGQHQARLGVDGPQHAVQAVQQRRQPLAPPRQRRGRLVALLSRRRGHPVVDLLEQGRRGALGGLEQRQRRVDLAAVGVGVQVAQAGGAAAAHLAVDRRRVAPAQRASAVAQLEQRRQVVGQLGRAACGPRSGPTLMARPAAGCGGDLEHRVLHVQPAAHVHPPVGALQRLLPGGRHCLIRRFSSTSAPSSELVGR